MLVAFALVVILAACSSDDGENAPANDNAASKSTIVDGEFETIGDDPDMLADGTSGMAIHEEAGDEALQQDRVSGGANTGGVASQNLDPLTDPLIEPQEMNGSYPSASLVGHPAAIPHELEGRDDCSSCHGDNASTQPVPKDHIKAGITNELCLECHKAAN